jgi:hypothetical protein
MKFLNNIMHDGSRQFLALPQSKSWEGLFVWIKGYMGVTDSVLLSDGVTEAWIDFEYKGQTISVNNQFGEYWFFVKNPECSDLVLSEIANHCFQYLCS